MRELATLGIDRGSLIAALQAQNIVRPAGVIQTGNETVSVRVSGAFQSEQDIARREFCCRRAHAPPQRYCPHSPWLRRSSPAAIQGERQAGDRPCHRDARGRRHSVARRQHYQRAMAKITANLPVGIQPILVADQAATVEHAIADFMMSLWQSVAIILVVSFISLGIRPGLVIALAIPLTLAIVFSLMELTGIDMQRISLGALIIALALLVDDAMTTTDATLSRLAQGDNIVDAATFAFRTYAVAMLAGTLVTIAGFVPVGFAASSAGEYTFSLFAVVAIALIVSWFVAVIFAPLLGVLILVPPKSTEKKEGFPLRLYRGLLTGAIQARWLTIPLALALFVASIFAVPLIPNQFFPSSDRPELMVDLTLPQNASIHATKTMAERFDAVLKDDPDVARWSTYVGQGAIRFYLPLDVQLPNDFFGQAVVVAKDVAAREKLKIKLEKVLAEEFPTLVTRVYPLELGPPVGWPVQYRVSGPDLAQVREIALKLAQVVAKSHSAKNVNFDWIEPAREVRIQIDQDQARLLGLSSDALANVLNTVISGISISKFATISIWSTLSSARPTKSEPRSPL